MIIVVLLLVTSSDHLPNAMLVLLPLQDFLSHSIFLSVSTSWVSLNIPVWFCGLVLLISSAPSRIYSDRPFLTPLQAGILPHPSLSLPSLVPWAASVLHDVVVPSSFAFLFPPLIMMVFCPVLWHFQRPPWSWLYLFQAPASFFMSRISLLSSFWSLRQLPVLRTSLLRTYNLSHLLQSSLLLVSPSATYLLVSTSTIGSGFQIGIAVLLSPFKWIQSLLLWLLSPPVSVEAPTQVVTK